LSVVVHTLWKCCNSQTFGQTDGQTW